MAQLLTEDSTVPQTGEWVELNPGVWKITLATTDSSAVVALEYSIDSGPPVAVTQNVLAISLTTMDPAKIVNVAEGEQWRAVRTGGSGAVTVHARQMTRI